MFGRVNRRWLLHTCEPRPRTRSQKRPTGVVVNTNSLLSSSGIGLRDTGLRYR